MGSGSNIPAALEAGLGLLRIRVAPRWAGACTGSFRTREEVSLALQLPWTPLLGTRAQEGGVFVRGWGICMVGIAVWIPDWGLSSGWSHRGKNGATQPDHSFFEFSLLQFSYCCVLFRIPGWLFFSALSDFSAVISWNGMGRHPAGAELERLSFCSFLTKGWFRSMVWALFLFPGSSS